MADELDQGIEVPGEGQDGSSLNPEIVAQKQEEKAREKGWRPISEYADSGKDPADWVDAKEFLGREFLYGTIRELKKELRNKDKKFEQDMEIISKQFAQMSEQAYKKAVGELKAERALAIEDRDVAAVENIDKQLQEAEKSHQTVASRQVQSNQGETAEFTEWKVRNEWFDKDKELQDEAVQIGIGYAARYKNTDKTHTDMLEHVEDRIKKLYPEKFGAKQVKKPIIEQEPAVEGNGQQSRPTATNKKGKVTVNDLSDEERKVMKTFIQRGAFKHIADKEKISQEDIYLRMIAEQRAKERK